MILYTELIQEKMKMCDYEFKEPVEFTIRLEKEYVEMVSKNKGREIESILEDVLSYWFEHVEVV